MIKALAFGLGAALAFALWKQSDLMNGQRTLLVAGYIVSLVLIYFAGRAKRPSAVATATAIATAEANATANQAVVVNVSLGAREHARAEFAGLDNVAWQGPATPLDMLDPDEVEQLGVIEASDADRQRVTATTEEGVTA
jgi:hypothetical protein